MASSPFGMGREAVLPPDSEEMATSGEKISLALVHKALSSIRVTLSSEATAHSSVASTATKPVIFNTCAHMTSGRSDEHEPELKHKKTSHVTRDMTL